MSSCTILYTHTRLTALFPRQPRSAGTRKVKPTWILLKQETVSGSGISWAKCKSAPCSRQTTTPAPHHSCFYRLPFLPPNQQHQSTEGTLYYIRWTIISLAVTIRDAPWRPWHCEWWLAAGRWPTTLRCRYDWTRQSSTRRPTAPDQRRTDPSSSQHSLTDRISGQGRANGRVRLSA